MSGSVSGMSEYQRAGMYRRRAQKWREVAQKLADRLGEHAQAGCPESILLEDGTRQPLHIKPELHPDCAFCADIVAYCLYLKEANKKENP
jgi:hypothetical protein